MPYLPVRVPVMQTKKRDFTKYVNRSCEYCKYCENRTCGLTKRRVNKWNTCNKAVVEKDGKRYTLEGVEDI